MALLKFSVLLSARLLATATKLLLRRLPPLMVSVFAASPSARAPPSESVPEFTITPPLKVFTPESVTTPVPALPAVVAMMSGAAAAFDAMTLLTVRPPAPAPSMVSEVSPEPSMTGAERTVAAADPRRWMLPAPPLKA